ncbi:MAG: DUF1549 domain-containing protein [Isosphaeraceae bacterium]|nr:DUF1549 domain-containing protein [Isosphaeraceae bacterium]
MRMGTRDLLFVGLVLGGAATLASSLLPNVVPARAARRPANPAPAPADPTIVREVNRELRREWAEAGVSPVRRAPELALMRRLSLALTGTIPSLEEIRRFEARAEDRRLSLWIDDLLADRRFADYVAERLARVYVGTEEGPFIQFRRRRFVTWLSDQLANSRPYDAIVRDLIADRGLWTDHPGTNFITVAVEPEKPPNPEKIAARVARAFLGVRLDCAQCHDHPFGEWKQRDFQGLAAFFGQVHTGFSGVYDGQGEYEPTNRKSGKTEVAPPGVPFYTELLPEEGPRRMRLARWVTDPRNPNLARVTVNRVWALMFGKPLVEPVDDILSVGEPPPLLKMLAADFSAHGFDLRRLVRSIAATEAFQRDSASDNDVTESQEKTWAAFPLTRLRPEQVVGGVLQSASLGTIDRESNVLVRLGYTFGQQAFVQRYGDTGEDDFSDGCGTIPQRLLLMNGDLVKDKTKDGLVTAASRIATLAPTDQAAVELAYLTVLTRRPTPEEAAHFVPRLEGTKGKERQLRLCDIVWTLINATEFSWSH